MATPDNDLDLAAEYASYEDELLREALHGLHFEDLAELLEKGLPEPTQLVEGLVIDQAVNWFCGHPEQGKTIIALWVAIEHMRNGGHVVWLDWENGVLKVLRRLLAMGAGADLIVGHFHYTGYPVIPADVDGLARIADALGRWPGALVVFDSASKALSVAGLSENNPEEATRWTVQIVMPVRERGSTVVVLDHVTKDANRHTPYPRGAGSKLADTDVAWYVEATKPFNREQAGELRLTQQKDRDGVLPQEVFMRVGDGEGGLPVEVVGAEAVGAGEAEAGERYGVVKGRVRDCLRKHRPRRISTTQLADLVTGKKATVIRAAKDLAGDLGEPVSSGPGKGANSVEYWYDEDAVPQIAREAP
jgi:hypothetical protein